VKVRLKPQPDGSALLELPPEVLETVGMKVGDLVEIYPMFRSVDGTAVESVVIIRKLRQ